MSDDFEASFSRLGLSASSPPSWMPFLEPDLSLLHRKVPGSSDERSYLQLVRHNTLAEYALFIKQQATSSRIFLRGDVFRDHQGVNMFRGGLQHKKRVDGGGWVT